MSKLDLNCEKNNSRRRYGARLLAAGVIMSGTVLLGSGVFAAWTQSSSTATGAYGAANLAVQMVDANGTSFSAGVNNLLPGDYINRYADLTNTGSVAQTFSATVSGTGTLTGAMTVQVDTCSVSWASNGTCSGTTTSVKAETTTSSPVTLSFPSLAVNGLSHARFRFKLDPNASQGTYQNTSAAMGVTITGSATVAGGLDRTAG